MTAAAHFELFTVTDLDEAELRERGLRLSTPRRLLLEAVFAAAGAC